MSIKNMTVSTNNTARVFLTTHGKEMLAKYFRSLGKGVQVDLASNPNYTLDHDGPREYQLRELMQIFGLNPKQDAYGSPFVDCKIEFI